MKPLQKIIYGAGLMILGLVWLFYGPDMGEEGLLRDVIGIVAILFGVVLAIQGGVRLRQDKGEPGVDDASSTKGSADLGGEQDTRHTDIEGKETDGPW